MDQKEEKNLQDPECFHFNPEVENVVSFGLNYIKWFQFKLFSKSEIKRIREKNLEKIRKKNSD